MGQVFLSYAREDRLFAGKLASVLEDAGHDVWWDRRLSSGEEFSAEIEAALNQADVVLVAWSVQSVKSRWVRDEAAAGGDTDRLVPVSIDGSLPPMGFRQFHSMDLTGWKGSKRDERTQALIQSVQRRMNTPIGNVATIGVDTKPRRASAVQRFGMWKAGVAILLLITIVTAGWWLWIGQSGRSGSPTRPTVALLPLTTATSDARLRELATETSDSISAKLSQSGFPVKLLTSGTQSAAPATDYIIAGDFSRDGDKVAATLHLNQAAQGVTIASFRFEASGDDVKNLPERIGVQTAGNLSGNVATLAADKQHPIDPAVLSELMRPEFASNDWLQSYQSVQRILEKTPDLRIAEVSLAYYTGFVLDQFPADQRAKAIADARHAYDKARELDPSEGDLEGAWCFLHSETLLAECEDHLRAGVARSPDDSWLNDYLAALLTQVGRFDEAEQLQQQSYTHDPYAPNKIAHTLRMLEFDGDTADAKQLYNDGMRWWPEQKGLFLRSRLLGLVWRGDFAGISRVEKEVEAPRYRPSTEIIAALNSKSIPSLRGACAEALSDNADFLFLPRCFVAFNLIGDEDSAYALAAKMFPRRVGANSAETDEIWINDPDGVAPHQLVSSPPAATFRRDPRFAALAQRLGLLDYWRSRRLPDFCKPPRPEPICSEMRKRG